MAVCAALILLTSGNLHSQNPDAVPGVEVIRISGPGTEPVMLQSADSIDFHITLKGGIVLHDPEVKYLKVESENFIMTFKVTDSGQYSFYLPNYGTDSFYMLTFLDKNKDVIAVYPLTLSDFQLHSISRITSVVVLPEAEIIPGRKYVDSFHHGWERPGGCWSYIIGARTVEAPRAMTIASPGVFRRPLLKVRVGYSPKVEYGTPDCPGIDLQLKLDDILE